MNDTVNLFLYFIRHPTSASSCADILSVLFFYQMKYKTSEPRDPASDRFVMSKVQICATVINFYSRIRPFEIQQQPDKCICPCRNNALHLIKLCISFRPIRTPQYPDGFRLTVHTCLKFIVQYSFKILGQRLNVLTKSSKRKKTSLG